jgi:rhamnogalacturonan endolyase
MEYLDRGVVALNALDKSVFISWRLLNSDPEDVSFDIFKSTMMVKTKFA